MPNEPQINMQEPTQLVMVVPDQATMVQPTTIKMVPPAPKVNAIGELTTMTQPGLVKCDKCGHEGFSETKKRSGRATWCLCLTLAWTIGFCWIPFCCTRTKNTKHYCMNCKEHLATHKRHVC